MTWPNSHNHHQPLLKPAIKSFVPPSVPFASATQSVLSGGNNSHNNGNRAPSKQQKSNRVRFRQHNVYADYDKTDLAARVSNTRVLTPEQMNQEKNFIQERIKYAFVIELKKLGSKRGSLVNPLTGHSIVRFGATYWKLLKDLFGTDSDLYIHEKNVEKKAK